jgi:hypothetical protein
MCIKYLALNEHKFKYPARAFICSTLNILTILAIETVNVYYVLCFDSVLDIINNFIKLRIVALFDDFFLYPFRQSSMSSYIGAKIHISNFRKDKIVID